MLVAVVMNPAVQFTSNDVCKQKRYRNSHKPIDVHDISPKLIDVLLPDSSGRNDVSFS
jgi:hypothetical protein